MYIRKTILGAASALALASPAAASDLPLAPYINGPTYERETHTYEHRTAPRVVVAEPETVIVRRPVVVAPRVVVEEYLVYAAPEVYAAPPVYAYAGPSWRHGWGHRHVRGGW
jgi:hypothetical protein